MRIPTIEIIVSEFIYCVLSIQIVSSQTIEKKRLEILKNKGYKYRSVKYLRSKVVQFIIPKSIVIIIMIYYYGYVIIHIMVYRINHEL